MKVHPFCYITSELRHACHWQAYNKGCILSPDIQLIYYASSDEYTPTVDCAMCVLLRVWGLKWGPSTLIFEASVIEVFLLWSVHIFLFVLFLLFIPWKQRYLPLYAHKWTMVPLRHIFVVVVVVLRQYFSVTLDTVLELGLVEQAGLELMEIHLPLPPKFWV